MNTERKDLESLAGIPAFGKSFGDKQSGNSYGLPDEGGSCGCGEAAVGNGTIDEDDVRRRMIAGSGSNSRDRPRCTRNAPTAVRLILALVASLSAFATFRHGLAFGCWNFSEDNSSMGIDISVPADDDNKSNTNKSNYNHENKRMLHRQGGRSPLALPSETSQKQRMAFELVDYDCKTDNDCSLKQVRNCCGTYLECVNVGFQPVMSVFCDDKEELAVCGWYGWSIIDGCICRDGLCHGQEKQPHIKLTP